MPTRITRTEGPLKRRWLPRFGLRTLIVAVAFFGVALGAGMFWYRSHEAEFHRQQQVAESIRQHGGIVKWKSSMIGWPTVCRNWDAFKRITEVYCGLAQGADSVAILNDVKSLPDVTLLDFFERSLENDDFVNVLPEIRNVSEVHICFNVGGFVPIETYERETKQRIEAGLAKVRARMPAAKVESHLSGG
jgi:hypothetical protein